MKRNTLLLLLLSLWLLASGQTYDTLHSYVAERVYLNAEGTKYVDNVTYLDGFGRTLQETQVKASPGGTADLIVPHRYGTQGRKEKEYLPFAKAGNNGVFVSDAYAAGNWNLAYGTADAAYAFTKTEYDDSPLSRVTKQTGAGAAWHTNGKGITSAYTLNGENEVRLYKVDLFTGTLSLNGYYRAGSLQKTTTTDEDGHQMETFTDNAGKTVLTVTIDGDTQVADGSQQSATGTKRLETYYVYDDRDQLRRVLSPEASYQLGTSIDTDVLNGLSYYYAYDRLGRMTEKHLPGCAPIYMVYDKRDRLVLSQDGNQRAADSKKWSYSVYDDYNRIIESGETMLATATTHKQLQDGAWDAENYLPDGTKTPLQYAVYGSYEATAHVTPHPFALVSDYASEYHPLVTGLVTSTKTRILGTDTWLTATTYYDEKSRPIQTVSDNQHGMLSTVNTAYDFVGNVLKQRETHGVTATITDVLETVNTYDERNRLLTATYTLNGGTSATVTYEYDAVGRLIKKHYGDNVTEQMQYNIRGWLTSKESTPFKMQLHYENPQAGATACYNGNISEWAWQQGTNAEQLYGFTYDGVNRLKETSHKKKSGGSWVTNANHYLEKGITYDRNGNILTLQRTGNGNLVDNLLYTYAGNRIVGQTYDANGNKTLANSLAYTYNLLGLQDKVYLSSTRMLKAQYDYLANGVKLALRDGSGSNGYDYDGRFIYSLKNGSLSLDLVTFADGQFTKNGVRYALTDHLRNVRALVDGSGTILEQRDYYPFGGVHPSTGYADVGNRHLLSGKESQLLVDAGIYDFGFRMYDSHAGSWNAVDGLCEQYYSTSPYMYANNNPVRYIDLWGLEKLPMVGGELYGGVLDEVLVTAKRKNSYVIDVPINLHTEDDAFDRDDISRLINGLDFSFSVLNESKETRKFKEYAQRMSDIYNHGINQFDGKYVWVKKAADVAVKPISGMVKHSKLLGRFVSGASVADACGSYLRNPSSETGRNVGVTAIGVVSFWGGLCALEYSIIWNAIKDEVQSWYHQGEQFMKDLETFEVAPMGIGY